MVSYTWQSISSSFYFAHSATAVCGVWSAETPATTHAELELLGPVHKRDFHRGLMGAGFGDSFADELLLSHLTGLSAKGHKYSGSPLMIHGPCSCKT